MEIVEAVSPSDIDTARRLFREYQAELGVDLCFQSFEEELAGLPGRYAPPSGRLLLAVTPAPQPLILGVVALRRIDDGVCELKRLFVRPEARGTGAGRQLTLYAIQVAIAIGYRALRLDTLPQMGRAIGLYRSLGFREIAPYTANPVPGALFLELDLIKRGRLP